MTKTAIFCLLSILVLVSPAMSQPPAQPSPGQEWTGTDQQKLWGLMQIWSEAKYAYPHFERLGLDWDATVQEFIPRAMAAEDMDGYYMVLMELVSTLKDSHTSVLPPWDYFKPGYDSPPVEVQVIDDNFYVARAGDTEETKAQRIYPGLEILEIDGAQVGDHFADKVLKYYTMGTKQADEAILVVYLLSGPKDSAVGMKVKDTDGAIRNVSLTRNSTIGNGPPFMYRFVENAFMAQAIESKMLEDGILYVKIPNFEHEQIETSFTQLIDGMDDGSVKGMLIDVRNNMGGSSRYCNAMVSCLIDETVQSPTMHYPEYVAAHKAWGRKQAWSSKHTDVVPRDGKKYLGPIVVLTGPVTNSTAEDLVIELMQTGRATTVGGRTEGGAGNPLNVPLPGGGTFRVATFNATFPDGTEYVGIGIKPDVEVYPTVQDLIDGTDPVLAKGVEVVKN
jgi:carboxyl-terminal processing protease